MSAVSPCQGLPSDGAASVAGASADGQAGVGTVVLLGGARGTSVPGFRVGLSLASDGEGVVEGADGAGGVVRPLGGGGASGAEGAAGEVEVERWTGRAISVATAQVRAAPAAARSSRRRDAVRRIVS